MGICETCGNGDDKVLRRPILRTVDGVQVFPQQLSIGSISASMAVTNAAGTYRSSVIAIPDIIRINQLPNASIKAHVSLTNISPVENTDSTGWFGWLYYADTNDRLHVIGAFANSLNFLSQNSILVAPSITDAYPKHLGYFVVEITVPGAASVTVNFRANIDIQYEA